MHIRQLSPRPIRHEEHHSRLRQINPQTTRLQRAHDAETPRLTKRYVPEIGQLKGGRPGRAGKRLEFSRGGDVGRLSRPSQELGGREWEEARRAGGGPRAE